MQWTRWTNLKQQLVLHDSLNRFNEQISDLKSVTQTLLQILQERLFSLTIKVFQDVLCDLFCWYTDSNAECMS